MPLRHELELLSEAIDRVRDSSSADRTALDLLARRAAELAHAAETQEATAANRARRLEAVLTTAADAIITIDARGKIESFNPAAERIFGYSADEAIGRNVRILMPQPDRAQHDSYISNYERTRNPKVIGIGRDVRGQRKDGTSFPLELAVTETPLGDKTLYTGVLRDITERRRAEDALRETDDALRELHSITSGMASQLESRLTALLRMGARRFGLPIGVLAQVEDDSYTVRASVSDAHQIVVGTQYNLGDSCCAQVLLADGTLQIQDAPADCARPCWEGCSPRSYLGIPVRVGDRLYGVLSFSGPEPRAAPFRDTEQEILKLMSQWAGGAILQSETTRALRESERQLHQSQKMDAVGRLAGGIAHDFKNLLTGIMGCCDVALMRMPEGDPSQRAVRMIRDASERGTAMIRQLLLFSRRQAADTQTVQVNSIVGAAAEMLYRLMPGDVRLNVTLGEDVGTIVLEPGQLEQIVMNLVINARDAMPEGGEINLRTTLTNNTVAIDVIDDGSGMDEHTRSRIFEPFFTTKGPNEGTGLGLATVYGIVQRHNGEIDVHSTVGEGTRFSIRFPHRRLPMQIVEDALTSHDAELEGRLRAALSDGVPDPRDV